MGEVAGTVVSRCSKDGYARSPRCQVILTSLHHLSVIAFASDRSFGCTPAQRHDVPQVILDSIPNGIIEYVPVVIGCDNQVDGRTWCDGMRPLDVKAGFSRPTSLVVVLPRVVHR